MVIDFKNVNESLAKVMESAEKVVVLFNNVDTNALEPNVYKLITGILLTQQQFGEYQKDYANIVQGILENNQAMEMNSFIMSSFIDSRNLSDEFTVFEASFDNETRLAEVLSLSTSGITANKSL